MKHPQDPATGLKLCIERDYPDFRMFYEANRTRIYDSIVEGFQMLARNSAPLVPLTIHATVEGISWDTEFKLSRERMDLLTDYIIPFFSSREDFEKCAVIQSIVNQLNNAA